jgi:large subunit ribosomal protein L22
MPDVKANARYMRLQPKKTRLMANLVRGLDVNEALEQLKFSKKKSAKFIMKTLLSAIANAENNGKMSRKDLVIKSIVINPGPILRNAKRMRIRARYSTSRIRRRTSHITVMVGEK